MFPLHRPFLFQCTFMASVFASNFGWLRSNVEYCMGHCVDANSGEKCEELLAEIVFRTSSLIAAELYGLVYIVVLWNAKHYSYLR